MKLIKRIAIIIIIIISCNISEARCLSKYPSKLKGTEEKELKETCKGNDWREESRWVKKRKKEETNKVSRRTRLHRFRMNASPVFPRILSAVSRRVHHPPGPRGSRGSLIPTWLYKGAIHRHGNVGGGRWAEREGGFKYILHTTTHILRGEATSCPDKNQQDEFPVLLAFDTVT